MELYYYLRFDLVNADHILKYNIFTIFLLGIPGQTSVILWSRLQIGRKTGNIEKVKTKKKKKTKNEAAQSEQDSDAKEN